MTETELKAIVRSNIKRYRDYRGWTQAQLAEKLEISINFLSDIENGKKWISLATMIKFASTFNIEPFELFKPADVPEPSVSALFARYNNEVIKSVSESLNGVYRYYQALVQEERSDKHQEVEPRNISKRTSMPDKKKLKRIVHKDHL